MLRKIKNSPQSTDNSPHLSLNNPISFFLSSLSGVLLGLPFFDGQLWIIAWVGFLPLFLAIQSKSKFPAFLLSYLTGIVFWSGTIYWLIHVTLLGQILLILYLALYFGLFGLYISAIRYPLSAIRLFSIPSLWILLEYLRTHLLSGFGWALLGYSQYLNLPIIQIADIFGVYGVSFLVMMVNVALWQLIEKRATRRIIFSLVSCVLCLVSCTGYGYYKILRTTHDARRTTLKISVIQGNIPQELKWDAGQRLPILEQYGYLTKKAALEKPDLIIWPEAANPGFVGVSEDDWLSKYIFALPKEIGIPLLLGSVVQGKNYYNSALLINSRGEIAGRYDKLHLVPFGEYIPFKKIFPFLETVVPIGDFTPGREYTLFSLNTRRKTQDTRHTTQDARRFAVLICFEDTIPELSRNFVRKGADFLINITNDAWFKQGPMPYQHLAASVFRAIENRVTLVRCANTGVSCFIDSCGRVKARVLESGKDIFISGVRTENIFLDRGKSLYQAIADAPIITSWLLLGLYAIIKPFLKRKV